MSHKVAIIGAGNVGSILGKAILDHSGDFRVKYGVRGDPTTDSKFKKLLKHQLGATIATVQDSIAWAEVIILAFPCSDDENEIRSSALSLNEKGTIDGKIVIDVRNPLSDYPHLFARVWKDGISGGEILQDALPKSFVYKAFNTVGAEHMESADGSKICNQQLTMLIAGSPDPHKRQIVENIVRAVGFIPCYVGPIRYSRNLEALAELWIHLGVDKVGDTKESWGRNFHFQVLRKM